jgi:heme/copper-type cytochrome/quinol oxidase subunit 4
MHDRHPNLRTEVYMPPLTISFILAVIALICGILMLVSGRWSRYPLAAIAVICLALNQTGLINR